MKYVLLVLLFPLGLLAQDGGGVHSSHEFRLGPMPAEIYNLSKWASYLNEKDESYSFDDVSSGKLDAFLVNAPDRRKNKGSYQKSFWARIRLRSGSAENTGWVLQTDKRFSEVKVYIVHDDGRTEMQQSGWSIEPSQRSVVDPDVIFNISLKDKEAVTVYMHVSTSLRWSSIGKPELKLIPVNTWTRLRLRTYNFLSVYAGICLLATFYWLINFIFMRKVNYLYLILAILSALFFSLDIFGITSVLWSDAPWYNLVKYGEQCLWFPLMVLSHFAISYKANSFRIYFNKKVLWWYWALCSFTVAFLIVGPFFFGWSFAHNVSLALSLLCMVLGVAMITYLFRKRGFGSTGFAILAILPFFLGISAYVFISFGVLPGHWMILTPIGSLLSVVMYFYGMVHYVRVLREKRNDEILKNDELIREQNVVLERTVQERTSELLEVERQKANEEINTLLKEQELRSVSNMLDMQEGERRRIASDLHDRLGSMLSTVKLYLGSVEEQMGELQGQGNEQYGKAVSLLDEACEEIRKISHDLVSGELLKFGLTSALRQLAKTIEGTGQLKVNVMAFGMESRLDSSVEIALYRVVQELVNNILKHSKAGIVNIQLTRADNELNIVVEDNGVGFDIEAAEEKGGMGIKNILSRVAKLNGQVRYDTAVGKGTTTIIEIPV